MTAASTATTSTSAAATAVAKASDPTKPKTRVSGRDVLFIDVMIDKFVSYVGIRDISSTSRVNRQWRTRVTIRLRLFEGLPCPAGQALEPTPLQHVCLEIARMERSLFGASGQRYNLEAETRANGEKWDAKLGELYKPGVPKYSLVTTLVKTPLIGSWLFPQEAQRQKVEQECASLRGRAKNLDKIHDCHSQKKALRTKWLLLNLVGGAKAAEKIPPYPVGKEPQLSLMTSPIMKIVDEKGKFEGLIITAQKAGELVGSVLYYRHFGFGGLFSEEMPLNCLGNKKGLTEANDFYYLIKEGKIMFSQLYESLRVFLQNGEALFDRSTTNGGSTAPDGSYLTQIAPKTLQREIRQRYPLPKKFQLK
jgi:hypothetical protein